MTYRVNPDPEVSGVKWVSSFVLSTNIDIISYPGVEVKGLVKQISYASQTESVYPAAVAKISADASSNGPPLESYRLNVSQDNW